MSAAPVIELSGVTRVYTADTVETCALSDVSLVIRQGDFNAIQGPSGAGKSTLLAILGLIDRPTAGSYRLAGEAMERRSLRELAWIRNRHIGFVFQEFNLIGDLTVTENAALPLQYAGVPRKERHARVHEALERVGIGHRADHRPDQLSGGEQQRVAIARAVVGRPSVILADEPTGNLDSENSEAVLDLLAELNEGGTTICMVTHDPACARRARGGIRMSDGRITEVPAS